MVEKNNEYIVDIIDNGYEGEGNNITFNFTNILKYENVITSVTANKIWNDNEGKVGARTSVTFELYKDGEATGITQTASDSLKWKVTFQNLQKYHIRCKIRDAF